MYCGEELLKELDTFLQDKNEESMKEEKKQEEKEPLFKVGQFVRIKKREGDEDDYKYSFTDDMAAFEGDICVINRVRPNFSPHESKQSDDNALYGLSGHNKGNNDPSRYNWASSMLEAIESPEPFYKVGQKVRIKKRVKGRYGTVLYTDDMNKHRGESHIIISVKLNPGACDDGDDFYAYELQKLDYYWTKSMLEPIEEEQEPKDEVAMLEENSEHLDKAYEIYKSRVKLNWPKNAKFHFNQKVQIASVITSDTPGFDKKMIDYAGNEASIEAPYSFKPGEYFYRLDEENGGDIWWPEDLLTEIN